MSRAGERAKASRRPITCKGTIALTASAPDFSSPSTSAMAFSSSSTELIVYRLCHRLGVVCAGFASLPGSDYVLCIGYKTVFFTEITTYDTG